MADTNGYVLRSRLVVAEQLGRPLEKGEVVHHLDGDKTNDSPNNLRLFENESKHQKHHHWIRKAYRLLKDLVFVKCVPTQRIDRAVRFVLTS